MSTYKRVLTMFYIAVKSVASLDGKDRVSRSYLFDVSGVNVKAKAKLELSCRLKQQCLTVRNLNVSG